MRTRRLIWIVLCLLCVAGAWFLRHETVRRTAEAKAAATAEAPPATARGATPLTNPALVSAAAAKTNPFAYRLSNTTRSIGQLVGDRKAILLENALIDSSLPVNFSFPAHLLTAGGDPGAYIVQSRGPINPAFRALLARAGAQIVSYIPENAYLVKVSAGVANGLAAQPPVQSVIPYEPYYKIQSSLLGAAVNNQMIGAPLNLGLFADNAAQTIQQIQNLGGRILSQDASPFGPVVRVQPPANWTALATLPGVQIVELFRPRVPANDLCRVYTGISVDTLVPTNYMFLTGTNVTVVVADSGIDTNHPAFTTGGSPKAAGVAPVRVQGYTTNDFVDTDGHGTFVAGQIAGNGAGCFTPVNVGGVLQADNYGSVTNADFRGKAPLATLYAINYMNNSDQTLQEAAALVTNALIENDSWNYDGDNTYSLEAAGYDAATRDALPGVTGSQPMLFVFSAGNDGDGDDDFNQDTGNGTPDSIQSPATAKNVITVGASELVRNITNLVTLWNGTTGAVWQAETSDGLRAAYFSSRGNVGIGIEGPFGRFKPDVVAPGTFVVSTRSGEWDTNTYAGFQDNPTNTDTATYDDVILPPDSLWINGFPIVPSDAVSVNITVSANGDSPDPFPTNLPIYFSLIGSTNFPGTTFTTNDQVNIPADGGLGIADILNSETYYGFNYGISNFSGEPISINLGTTIVTTNGAGNGGLVLSNLDNTLGPYYRFETGTSMAAADVSGTLALMQDFFTNTLHTLPSPALLKAMLINGARPSSYYNLQVTNVINYVGWGLINLPNSLPTGIQTNYNGTKPAPVYFQDQSPTNALATGDSHTFLLTVKTNTSELRVTLVWTDPPGNPAAAIKLVNNLELVMTNLDNKTNPVIYYGNDIPAGYIFNTPESRTNTVVPDSINNVQNVIIPPYLGTNYSITILGRGVNVNAVSAQTNSYATNANPVGVFAPNVVQDYALVVSSIDGGVGGAFTVVDKGIISNPTGDQDITYVTTTNQPYLEQFVGANPPLLGTNAVSIGTNTVWGTNGAIVLGMTNQWHFYVVTNNGMVSSNGTVIAAPYAAFVTFSPAELSVPRMGVFADPTDEATRPQADIDLYVTTDSNLMILSPLTVSNCLTGVPSPNSAFNGVSLTRGGTQYVVDTNSTAGEVYYIGVKSEDQMGSEYDFMPVFSSSPFSTLDANGDEYVNGIPVPVNIPDGSPSDPGVNFVLGLALYPINVGNIIVTNVFTHQNFGDLYGTLTHDDSATGMETVDVLNNHDGLGSITNGVFIYDDSGTNTAPGIIPSDGPGSLRNYFGQDGSGVWRLTEADTSLTQTGSVQNFTMFIKKRTPLGNGSGDTNTVAPQQWFYDFVDVPAGATNLTISVTNLTTSALYPLDVFVKLGAQPTTNDYDQMAVVPTTPLPQPGISLSIGPADLPPLQPGRYWIGVFNPDTTLTDPSQTFVVFATILPANPVGLGEDFDATNSTVLLDDAVTNAEIWVETNLPVVSVNVGIRVVHPRISDLDFHLISPSGTRVDLMQNRGGADTNGAGATIITTNNVNVTANGNAQPETNYLNVGEISGTLAITYNFYTAPDEMTIYYGYGTDPANLIYDTGLTNNPGGTVGDPTNTIPASFTLSFAPTNGITSTYLTIVMDQFTATNRGDLWTYTAGGVLTNYTYLTFTEDTNLTTMPITFAVPPFVPPLMTPTNIFTNTFGGLPQSDYVTNQTVTGWTVAANQVSVVVDPTNAYEGSNFLALASGSIFTNLPTVPGQNYTLTFAYRGPGIAAWWRGESNTVDSINGINATTVTGITYTNGEVGRAFNYNGSTSRIIVTNSASLAVSNLTLEAWILATNLTAARPVIVYGGAGQTANIQLWINTTNTTIATSVSPGALHALVRDAGGVTVLEVDDPNPVIKANQWNHVAFTANLMTGTGILYCNGFPVMTNPIPTPITCQSFENVDLGCMSTTASGEPLATRVFFGRLDEVSIYNRPLSDSEIKAIYNLGDLGKFDPNVFNSSPALSLAEAQVNVGNETPVTILGNNTSWQTETISFTATQTETPVQITGIEPGMLVDDFILTQEPGNLYYLPEQSLDAVDGEGAQGWWQLEIQDDRAGAYDTNSPPALLSWDLEFVFANTNVVASSVIGGIGQSNQFVPPNDIAWYQVTVPANASIATNLLLFASAPVNVWFSTNAPPTITNSAGGDFDLIPNSTGNFPGGATLYTNTLSWPYIVPGGIYYLGVQNTNLVTVNYGIKVNFNVTGQYSSLVLSSITASSGGTSLAWTASPSAQFEVQWTDDLTQPWNTITNPVITTSGGVSTFTDDGSQTAPPGVMRFYRLVQISP